MNKRQFQLNGYATLFGNYSEALFIYSKFGNVRRYSEGDLKLSNLNRKLVNKIMSNGPLLAGSNYALSVSSNACNSNFDERLLNLLVGHNLFVHWLEKSNLKDKLGLQSLVISGLMFGVGIFNLLSKPLNLYIKNNKMLLSSGKHLGFSNSLKIYLILPVMSFTLLSFLKLLLIPFKTTFGLINFARIKKG
jgi:hypothetical protein